MFAPRPYAYSSASYPSAPAYPSNAYAVYNAYARAYADASYADAPYYYCQEKNGCTYYYDATNPDYNDNDNDDMPPLISSPSSPSSLAASPASLVAPYFPPVRIHTLYIPYVGDVATFAYIRDLFIKKRIAMVKDVDFVVKSDYYSAKSHRSAYIHIDYWFFSDVAADFIGSLNAGEETRLSLSGSSYWIVLTTHAKKHKNNGRKLRIQLEEDDSDMPCLVNLSVYDEKSAHTYEWARAMGAGDSSLDTDSTLACCDESESDFLETDADSYTDTLDIGLKHDDCDYLITDSESETDMDADADMV